MSMVVNAVGTTHRPYAYDTEKEFEATVVKLADDLFGGTSIYIDIKKRVKGNDVISIPDGYVIDVTEPDDPKLFVVENEIARHDPFRHIGVQLLRFATSVEGALKELRDLLMQEIMTNPVLQKRLEAACAASKSRNIDNYLDRAVYGDFRAVVVIDEAGPDLYNVLKRIRGNISVLELRTFVSDSGDKLHLFDTLYDEETEPIGPIEKTPDDDPLSPERREARRRRRAESDTIIVPAREEGFEKVFLGEDRWWAIRVGAAMKDRIRYIAAYQVAPVSAVTHLAEVRDIVPYQDTGKYEVIFNGPAKEITHVPLKDPKSSPQGPVYVRREDLMKAKYLEEALSARSG